MNDLTHRFFFFILIFSNVCIADSEDFGVEANLYSQTLYDARISGATNETNIKFSIPKFSYSYFKPYVSLNYSKDLSNGRAPILTENMVAPGVGTVSKLLSFLYAFVEGRRLYRIENKYRGDSENELRYGLYAYDYHEFDSHLFNEFYAESVVVDRVDTKPVTLAWNKLGLRYHPYEWLRPDFYLEGFIRISPNPGYGPDENELRVGSRVTFLKGFWSLGASVYYAPVSNVEKHGVDALLVIAREVY